MILDKINMLGFITGKDLLIDGNMSLLSLRTEIEQIERLPEGKMVLSTCAKKTFLFKHPNLALLGAKREYYENSGRNRRIL